MSLRDVADRLLGRRREEPRLELPPVRTSAELLDDLAAFEAGIDDRVPPAVESRVARVTGIVRETIPRLDQLGAGSYQAHSVIATATSYLPEAVGAYLRLPRSWADTRPVSGGKTSLMVLCDQLDLLGYKMDQVFDAVCRADAAALVAHGAFLAEKFGSGGGLDLGGPAGSSGPSGPAGSSSTTGPPPEPQSPGRLQPPGAS
jgi:hypothetical protein